MVNLFQEPPINPEDDTQPHVALPDDLLEADPGTQSVTGHILYTLRNFGGCPQPSPLSPPILFPDPPEDATEPLPLPSAPPNRPCPFECISDASLLDLHANLRLFLLDASEFVTASPTGPAPIFAWQRQAEADLSAMAAELQSRNLS